MFLSPKFFISPMSLNLIDIFCKYKPDDFGLIISRRQIDYKYGYVGNLSTQNFYNKIVRKNKKLILCRDHGGPNQGTMQDEGFKSIKDDFNFLDIIHIDPFKKYFSIKDVSRYIQKIIYLSNKYNYKGEFEIGTESSIFPYSPHYLNLLLNDLYKELSLIDFKKIKYCVIQSGTAIDIIKKKNNGIFDKNNLLKFIKIIKKNEKFSKEHNGDYLSNKDIRMKFKLGLDALNIAPEIVQIENEFLYNYLNLNTKKLKIALNIINRSVVWKKWLKFSDVSELSHKKLFISFAHYFYSNEIFSKLLRDVPQNFYSNLSKKVQTKLDNFLLI